MNWSIWIEATLILTKENVWFLATAAIDKGMPIEQVQRLLGHEKIDTTLRYAQVKQSNVKSAHKKYIG